MTRQHGLDGDPIADIDAPAARGLVADRLDDPYGLVPGDHRHRRLQNPLELLVVAATDPAGLDPQNRAVRFDIGDGQVTHLKRARRRLNHRKGLGGNHGLRLQLRSDYS